jgi:hypothetical protein
MGDEIRLPDAGIPDETHRILVLSSTVANVDDVFCASQRPPSPYLSVGVAVGNERMAIVLYTGRPW